MGRGSTTVHTLEFRITQVGAQQVASSLNTLSTGANTTNSNMGALNNTMNTSGTTMTRTSGTTNQYSGSLGNVNRSLGPVQGGLRNTNVLVGQNAVAMQTAAGRTGEYSTRAQGATQSIIPMIGRVTGLSFAFTGLFTAMGEAQGMQELLGLQQEKVNELTAEQARLLGLGLEETSRYEQVTRQLEKAERGLAFQQRVTNLSTQDQYFFFASIAGQSVPALVTAFQKLNDSQSAFALKIKGLGSALKTNLISGFTGLKNVMIPLPEKFTSAGKSANTFGMQLKALALNPFMIAITAVTTILTLFITNMFGARDAINAFGVWLGNTFPFLKGFLEYLGKAGDALVVAFGGSINQVTSDMQDFTPEALRAQEAIIEFFSAVQNYKDIVELENRINALKASFGELQWKGQAAAQTIRTEFISIFATDIPKASAAAQAKFLEIVKLLNDMERGTVSAAGSQKLLTQLIDEFTKIMGGEIETVAKSQDTKKKAQAANKGFESSVANIQAALAEEAESTKKANEVLSEQENIVFEVAKANNDLDTTNKNVVINMLKSVDALAAFGKNAVVAKDGTFDLDATLKKMAATQDLTRGKAKDLWGEILHGVTTGKLTMQEAQIMVEAYQESFEEFGELGQEAIDGVTDKTKLSAEQLKVYDLIVKLLGVDTEETGKKSTKTWQEIQNDIDEAAKELGIYNDIQALSQEQQEEAIALKENEQKATEGVRSELLELARARGLDISAIGQSNFMLRDYIKNNELEEVTYSDVQNALTILTAKREEDAKKTDIQTKAMTQFVNQLGIGVDTTGLSVQGMESLIKSFDDFNNASTIATDDITTWRAELVTNQRVEAETMKQLGELANTMGVEIPQSVLDKGVPAVKEFLEAMAGIGPGAQKAADQAKKEFESMSQTVKKSLEGIISDKLGEDSDNVKKALKGIRKVTGDLNNLASQELIIDIFLNDDNIENDIDTMGEMLLDKFGKLRGATNTEALLIGEEWVENLNDQIGKKSPETVATVEKVWEMVKNSAKPGESGDVLLGKFQAALKNPNTLDVARASLNQPIETALAEVLGITEEEAAKISPALQGALKEDEGDLTSTADSSLKQPVIDAEGNIVTESETALDPVEGIFSQAFLDASQGAITQVILMMSDINKYVEQLKLNVAGHFNEMKDFVLESMTALDTGIKEGIWQSLSDFSTSVDTYNKSMADNVEAFKDSAIQSYDATEENIKDGIWATASDFSKSIATYSDSMANNIDKFAKSANKSLDSVIKKFDQAIDKVDDFIGKLNDIPDTVNVDIKQNFTTSGKKYFGTGGSFIVSQPTNIGDKVVGDGGPEIITVTPLSKSAQGNREVSLTLAGGTPGGTEKVQAASPIFGQGGSSGFMPATQQGPQAPIIVNVSGNINAQLRTVNGRIMAQEIIPYALEGSSSLT